MVRTVERAVADVIGWFRDPSASPVDGKDYHGAHRPARAERGRLGLRCLSNLVGNGPLSREVVHQVSGNEALSDALVHALKCHKIDEEAALLACRVLNQAAFSSPHFAAALARRHNSLLWPKRSALLQVLKHSQMQSPDQYF
jgi:hypothetical protein